MPEKKTVRRKFQSDGSLFTRLAVIAAAGLLVACEPLEQFALTPEAASCTEAKNGSLPLYLDAALMKEDSVRSTRSDTVFFTVSDNLTSYSIRAFENEPFRTDDSLVIVSQAWLGNVRVNQARDTFIYQPTGKLRPGVSHRDRFRYQCHGQGGVSVIEVLLYFEHR
jgi:hypothetical protein